jgi:hypothetical protein
MNAYKGEHISNQSERTLSKSESISNQPEKTLSKSEKLFFTNKHDSKPATNNNENNCKIDTNNKEHTNQNYYKTDNNNDCKTNSYISDCCIVHDEINFFKEINVCKEINIIVVKKKIDLYDKKEINGLHVIRETKQTMVIDGINVIQVLWRKPLYEYIDL